MNLLNNYRSGNESSRSRSAFTLTELIVTLVALCVFIGLLLPALGRAGRKSGALECKDNLRQIHVAMDAYAADHSDSLPGPQWRVLYYNYNNVSSSGLQNGMAYFLASYMGYPAPTAVTRTNDTLRCPSSKQIALAFPTPPGPAPAPTQVPVSYLLATYVTNGVGVGNRITNVFGYPNSAIGHIPDDPPAKISKILRPSDNWAIVDIDQQNFPTGPFGVSLLPRRPVHNNRPDGGKNVAGRNYLYFDGSVRSMVDNF